MYKVSKDFNHLGTEYKGGQAIKPSAFSEKDLQGLINKGLIEKSKEPKKALRSKK